MKDKKRKNEIEKAGTSMATDDSQGEVITYD